MDNPEIVQSPQWHIIGEAQQEPETVVKLDGTPRVRTVSTAPVPISKAGQVKEGERVQFNKRVTREVADGFEILAIRTRTKVPELLAKALVLLERFYDQVS